MEKENRLKNNCTIEVFEILPSGKYDSYLCDGQIMIMDSEILLEYLAAPEEKYIQRYRGKMIGPGHWLLIDEEKTEKITLHSFPESLIFEGYCEIKTENRKGFIRITLYEKSTSL